MESWIQCPSRAVWGYMSRSVDGFPVETVARNSLKFSTDILLVMDDDDYDKK
jgi:hypothetical protein